MKQRKIPQRKCVACHKMLSKKEMVRIVRTPEGTIEMDLSGKKNGRGAYVCGKWDGFKLARKQKALDRALKANISGEVYDELEQVFIRMNEKYSDVKCEMNDEK
jgi:predicted RNA-binding protein YlxR (DUF448 family)